MKSLSAAAYLWAYDTGSRWGFNLRPRTLLILLGVLSVLGVVPAFGLGLVMVKAANGAGKSTLVELISGYVRAQDGDVRVCGLRAESAQARVLRRVVRTKPALYPTMSVYDHLAFVSRLSGVSIDRALERVTRYRLDEWLDVRANELSAGTERKLWLIMCSLGDFEVIVLDEPFTGLDDQARGALLAELEEHRALGRLVVVVTHEHPAGFDPDLIIGLGQLELSFPSLSGA